jgi:hypothetical protein
MSIFEKKDDDGGMNDFKKLMLGLFIALCVIVTLYLFSIYTESKKKEDKKEPMTQNLNYGGNNIKIGNNRGLKYIYSDKNGVNVPNSKTAMRELFDESAHKCGSLDTLDNFDTQPSQIFLNKKKYEDFNLKKTPRSLTSTRYKTI